jgi:hypothetical protein
MPRDKKAVEETEGDHITEFDQRVERLTKIAEDAEFESGTLLGDIRDTMLEQFKHRPKPWSQMSESEQRDLAKALENSARTLLRKLVIVVAEEDLPSVHATLKGYGVKGDIFSLKAEARGDEETALQLFKLDGHDVVLMSASADRFLSQRKDPDVQPDQPGLALDTGGESEDEDVDLEEAAEEAVAAADQSADAAETVVEAATE